jgi:L-lactate dehydrogenase complex protein LldG
VERERFLDAIATRLGRPRVTASPLRPTFSVPWPQLEGQLAARFSSELERVGGTVSHATSLDAVRSLLGEAISTSGETPAVAVARTELEAFGLDTKTPPFDRVSFWGDVACKTPDRFRRLALVAGVGITTAVCAVASTGTLVLAASTASPRSASLLPRRHVALIRESQIVPHLGGALALGSHVVASQEQMPSALVCVTGPSRTSDIENDLSIGVHGPAQVHVIIYREASA